MENYTAPGGKAEANGAATFLWRRRCPGTFTRGRRRSPKSKGAMWRLCEGNGRYRISSRIVHFKFNRMRGVFEADHLSHLQLDIAVDEIVIEHPAGLQEVAIFLEIAD